MRQSTTGQYRRVGLSGTEVVTGVMIENTPVSGRGANRDRLEHDPGNLWEVLRET
jgi:hypothetical protein